MDENDKPIEGKDRLEWIKGVYNSVPKGMAQMFWALVFIIVLTGILMALHIFIFKNIGLFITQSEIAGRGTNNLKINLIYFKNYIFFAA